MGNQNFIIAMIIALVCVLYYFYIDQEKRIIVEISNGKLNGYQVHDIHAFESVPYAEPPIGEARFEPPKEYSQKWNEVRNAKSLPEPCMQWSEFKSADGEHVFGVEDCLYLNVYSPNVESNKLYPVVIFIHGGAFMHGGTKLLDSFLARKEKNFVYVTVGYRVGPLGFLGTEDKHIPGNMGLKDQQMAIKWVKKNIKAFKGDPENVVISGFSAGGASVHYHLLSKKTEGLIKAAVSHSGSALCSWASIQNPLMRTQKLAAHVGCPTDNTKSMKDCLKNKDAREIVRAVEKFFIYLGNPFTVFGPVVEPKSSKEPFLVENIENLIKNGKTAKIPWLIAYTVDEGVYNAAYLMKKNENGVEMIEQLDERWEEIAPLMLFFNESVPIQRHAEIANYYKKKYLGDEKISKNTYWKVQKMCTDRYFLEGIQKAIELHRDYSDAPVYVYAFDHPAPINLGQVMSGRNDIYFGTGHGDDVYLIFSCKLVREPNTYTKVEEVIVKKLINLYENFVKTGIPKYGDIVIQKNTPKSQHIKLLRIKGTEGLLESTTLLE